MIRRAFASFLAVWFAVIAAEPAALHVCAMHGAADAPASPAGHAGHAAPAVHEHGARAAHEHGAPQTQQQTGQQDEEEQPAGACTCLGTCSAVTVASLPEVPVNLAAPLAVRAAVPALPQHRAAPTLVPGLRLPFSTAPPILPA